MSFSAITLVTVANRSPEIALRTLISKKKVFTATVPQSLQKDIFAPSVPPPLQISTYTPGRFQFEF